MKNRTEITRQFVEENFKKTYTLKMKGTQRILMPDGSIFFFDDRQWYQGRGTKYNSSIRHEMIEITVTPAMLKEKLKELAVRKKESLKNRREIKRNNKARAIRLKAAKKLGVYSIHENHVEIPEGEEFSPETLANTLKISIEDAKLLYATGKCYVFAKSEDGNVYELFHPDLSCNRFNIHVSIADAERISQFDFDKWNNAPFAKNVGMSGASNQFVC
jgi:hypothetical protein